MIGQIRGHGIDKLLLLRTEIARRSAYTHFRGQCTRDNFYFRRTQHQPMVGLGARRGRRTLRHVEAVHLVAILQFASAHEVSRIAQKAGKPLSGEEVRVKRDDHCRVFKLINRIVICAEGQFGSGAHVVAIHRVPAMPLRLRKGLLYRLHLPAKGWRSHSACKKAQPRTLPGLETLTVINFAIHRHGKVAP